MAKKTLAAASFPPQIGGHFLRHSIEKHDPGISSVRGVAATFLTALVTVIATRATWSGDAPPYPSSPIIAGIIWDFSSRVQTAPGSDLWPITWGSDGCLYTSWGDGGGFGGTNTDGRVSLGVARIAGTPPDLIATNVFGGKNAETPSTFDGKIAAIVSIDGVLYIIVTEQDAWLQSKVGRSTDFGRTWRFNGGAFSESGWEFAETGGAFAGPAIVQFGRDYGGARDNFVYLYSEKKRETSNKDLLLARAPKDQLQHRSAYEFFVGMNDHGNPLWTGDVDQAEPVFTDPNGVNWGFQASYHFGVKRYLLTVRRPEFRGGSSGAWGIFDAPEPWGPWTTVAYYSHWADGAKRQITYSFPVKWMSNDGKTIWMVVSMNDSFNVIKGTVILRETTPHALGSRSDGP